MTDALDWMLFLALVLVPLCAGWVLYHWLTASPEQLAREKRERDAYDSRRDL